MFSTADQELDDKYKDISLSNILYSTMCNYPKCITHARTGQNRKHATHIISCAFKLGEVFYTSTQKE